jgi:ribonuclease D
MLHWYPSCCCFVVFSHGNNAACLWQVFHGAVRDIEWLQRDLCLYVVNMFDTHEAAKILNFAQLSLAFLMKHYCNVIADKHFQLADWRIRYSFAVLSLL